MYFSKKDEITDKGKKVKNIEKYCLNKNAGKDLYYIGKCSLSLLLLFRNKIIIQLIFLLGLGKK